MIVNVVMLHHGRIRLVSQALRTLERNTRGVDINLTLVMDGPDVGLDKRIDIQHSILWVTPEVNVTGRLRNLGIYWSEKHFGRGDYLYLSDDDVYFTPNWLIDMTHVLSHGDERVKVLGGWNHPFLQRSEYLSEHWMVYDPMDKHLLEVYSHDAVAGASQLMKWETWDKYGPLDAHAKGVGQSEDWKFCQDIIKDGGRVGSVYPRVCINCGITNSFGQPSPGADLMVKELQEAKKQYPDLYWE